MTTPLYAALLTLLYIALSVHIIRGRRRHWLGLGDGGHEEMRGRIRAHGNFAEYAPLFVILLALSEIHGLPVWAVHVLGCGFFAGRLSHAYSLLRAERYEGDRLVTHIRFRFVGMVCTFTALSVLTLVLLGQYFLK